MSSEYASAHVRVWGMYYVKNSSLDLYISLESVFGDTTESAAISAAAALTLRK